MKAHPDLDGRPLKSIHALNLDWLLKLRWSAAVGQALTILGVRHFLDFDPPLLALGLIIGFELLTNVAAVWFVRRGSVIGESAVAALMLIDLVCLTGLLYFTGGPHNPFNFLYLVHIALASVVLRPRWTWILAFLSAGLYGLLFFDSVPLNMRTTGHHDHMWMHLEGMWVAFVVAAVFIATFVHRVTSALSRREADLATAREVAQRNQRLASLATLAAGAAHELSTPLATIAVLSKELSNELSTQNTELAEDARLIRAQVKRCRAILDQLAVDAGQNAGEVRVAVPVTDMIHEALDGLALRHRVRLSLDQALENRTVAIFRTAVVQALRGVVKNALESSPGGDPVDVHAALESGMVRLRVEDRGTGMTPEVLERIGEPFFTTKTPGSGMGLGLFLTRTVLERVGGHLKIDSRPGEGTVATLSIPCPKRPR